MKSHIDISNTLGYYGMKEEQKARGKKKVLFILQNCGVILKAISCPYKPREHFCEGLPNASDRMTR